MVQTQWEKQTGLCLRKQMQQASAQSYFAHFKDKKQKKIYLFRREKGGEITPKIPCKLLFSEILSALSPSSSHTCWINKTQMFPIIHPLVQPPLMPCLYKTRCLAAYALESHRDQLLLCTAMYKLCWGGSRGTECALYFHTGKTACTEPCSGALRIWKLSAYKKHDFWLAALGICIPAPCLFGDTMFPLPLAQCWTGRQERTWH